MSAYRNKVLTLEQRMEKVETIEKKYGVQHLTGVIEQITEDQSIPVTAIGFAMEMAIVEVLEMENPTIPRKVGLTDSIRNFIRIRREKLGLVVKD